MSKAALALLATSVNSIPHIKGITINPGVVHTKMFDAVRCSIGGNCIKCLRMLLKHIVLTPVSRITATQIIY